MLVRVASTVCIQDSRQIFHILPWHFSIFELLTSYDRLCMLSARLLGLCELLLYVIPSTFATQKIACLFITISLHSSQSFRNCTVLRLIVMNRIPVIIINVNKILDKNNSFNTMGSTHIYQLPASKLALDTTYPILEMVRWTRCIFNISHIQQPKAWSFVTKSFNGGKWMHKSIW